MRNILSSIPYHLFRSVFHYKEVAQHKQFYFYNKRFKLSSLMEQDKQSYYPLNLANMELAKLCGSLIKKNVSTGDLQSDILKNLEAYHQEWSHLHQTVGPYDSFRLASKIAADLKLLNINLHDEIKKHPEILRAFIDVSSVIKFFFQFSLLIEEENLFDRLSEIAVFLKEHAHLPNCVRELTVYAEPMKNEVLLKEYRLVRIKFSPERIVHHNDSVLQEYSIWLADQFNSMDTENSLELNLYAKRLAPNFYVSQGNTNYKKFLNLLGILDRVYDEQHNFAYAIQ